MDAPHLFRFTRVRKACKYQQFGVILFFDFILHGELTLASSTKTHRKKNQNGCFNLILIISYITSRKQNEKNKKYQRHVQSLQVTKFANK